MRIRNVSVIAGVLAATLATMPATAQRRGIVERPRAPRSTFGINGALTRPVGEFQNFVDWGGGFGLYGVVGLSRRGTLGLRIDGGFTIYGHESFERPLSNTVQRVVVDVNTDNYIFTFGIGPQLTFGQGPIRPYVYGTAGFSYFATVSSVAGDADAEAFASSTNFDDVTPQLTGGAGVMLRLSRGKHPVSLDLSAQKTVNGEATYLRRGGILESPDGTITMLPIRSETNLVNFRLGIAVGI